MSSAPSSLQALAAYWVSRGGMNLGIVGDSAHPYGYHIGRDRIYSPAGKGDADYSVKQPRDKAGLTNAACALDLGRLNGTLTDLQKFNRWLVAQCQSGAPGTEVIREIIYTPDGLLPIRRYESLDGRIHTGPGNGDSTHLYHTHISFWRDTVNQVKPALFAGYFEQPTYRVQIAPSARIEIVVYSAAGAFERWSTATWGTTASSAPCKAIRKIVTPDGIVDIARVTAGKYAGRDIHVDPALGVTVESA